MVLRPNFRMVLYPLGSKYPHTRMKIPNVEALHAVSVRVQLPNYDGIRSPKPRWVLCLLTLSTLNLQNTSKMRS